MAVTSRMSWLGLGSALLGLVVVAARADEPAPGAPGAPGGQPPAETPPAPFPGRADRLEAKVSAAWDFRRVTDKPLHDALRWLAAHQSPNGRWEADGFEKWCSAAKSEEAVRPDGTGDKAHDVGVTGLALCAFLGAGYTDRGEHEFQKVVKKGLAFLRESQDEEGCIGRREVERYVYNHATASLALVDAYGMTGDEQWRGPAQKAIAFIEFARNPQSGWRYGVKWGGNDTSVTGWMCHVLASARLINEEAAARGKPPPLRLDPEVAEGVRSWLGRVTDRDSGRVGYLGRGTGPDRTPGLEDKFPRDRSEAPTAVAVFTRIVLLRQSLVPRGAKDGAVWTQDALDLHGGISCMERVLPAWLPERGTIDMTYWYFGTLAVHQANVDPGRKWMKESWRDWSKALLKALLESQRKDGTHCGFKGSWDPIDPWGTVGGRVYSTSMLAMCLEAPYRYPRVLARPR